MSNHKTAAKWRNLIDGYRLHYDLIRLSLIDVAAGCGAKSPGEAVSFWETATRAVVTKSKILVNMLRPGESLIDGYCRVLRENLGKPVVRNPNSIETMPSPTPITAPHHVDLDRVVNRLNEIGEELESVRQEASVATDADVEEIHAKVPAMDADQNRWMPSRPAVWEETVVCAELSSFAAAFLSEALLISERTRLFVLGSNLMRDVVASRNDPIQGDDLGLLPFPQMWVEFDAPVEFARGFTRPFNVIGAGLWCVPNSPLRLIYLVSDLMCSKGEVTPGGHRLVEAQAALFLLFWGNQRILGTADRELSMHLGFDPDAGHPHWQCMLESAQTSAKNLYDFLTCRSFDYVTKERQAKDFAKIKRYQHLQGALAKGARHYRMVKVNQEILKHEDFPGGERTETPFSVDVPGCFHRWVYCRACGDTHRHDLIGSACRKCGLTVGPTANITVQKWWHPPHTRGSGPKKEYVRNLVD